MLVFERLQIYNPWQEGRNEGKESRHIGRSKKWRMLEREGRNLGCRSPKIETANEVERLASRIEVREAPSPPESEKRRAPIQEEQVEMLPRYLKNS